MRVGSTHRPTFTVPRSAGRRHGWKPPYALPDAGKVLSIGVNTEADMKPSTHSSADWTFSLMGSYGGGAFVEEYSVGGAYVIAGSGGHAVPPNLGAAIFDFADATWKRLDNSNGVANRNTDFDPAELDGSAEILAATKNMPAPSHLYANVSQIKSSQGGGPKGSIGTFYLRSAATDSSQGSNYAFTLDLNNGRWRRASTNGAAVSGGDYRSISYDPVDNRYYKPPMDASNGNPMVYLDANDWTWKTISFTPSASVGASFYSSFIDVPRRVLVTQQDEILRAWDLDDIGSGATTLTVSGTPDGFQDQWHRYPADECWYVFGGYTTSAVIKKLKPPPLGTDPLIGTWTYSTVAVDTALQQQPQAYIDAGAMGYTRWFFVPSIGCFAWIPGDNFPVQIVRPPA